MNDEVAEHYLDTTARNYLRAKRCEELAKEIEYCYKAKIKITKRGRDWNTTNTIKDFDTSLLAEAFKTMDKEYRKSSIRMLKNVGKELD